MAPLNEPEIDKNYVAVVADDRIDPYEADALCPGTWRQYKTARARYQAWCIEQNEPSMPATTDRAWRWVKDLVEQQQLTVETALAYLSGLVTVNTANGFVGSIDRELLRLKIRGLRNRRGSPPRQAVPLLNGDLRSMLEALDPQRMIDCRDAALLSLCWCGALRRSELAATDWLRRGSGDVALVPDHEGFTLWIYKAKRQREPRQVALPKADTAAMVAYLERWVERARISPGAPLFRRVTSRGFVSHDRLAAAAVNDIVRQRYFEHAIRQGRSHAEARYLSERITAHSLRSGFATSAALAGVIEGRIRDHMRHSSPAMTARYIRLAQNWRDSALKSVGI